MNSAAANAIRLALLFSRQIQDAVSPAELALIRVLNINRGKSSYCASHDFCDAAAQMNTAFEKLAGRPLDPGNGQEVEFCDTAWKLAKRFGFYAQGIAVAYDLELATGLRNVHSLCGDAPIQGYYYGLRGTDLVKRRSPEDKWLPADLPYHAAKLINEDDKAMDLSEPCRDADNRFDTRLEAKWRKIVEDYRSNRWANLAATE